MARQFNTQREYVRDIRTHNSINYSAKSIKPRCLQNIDIILKTMKYNELADNPNPTEAMNAKVINIGLLIFTVLFEALVITMKTIGFLFAIGKKRRRSW